MLTIVKKADLVLAAGLLLLALALFPAFAAAVEGEGVVIRVGGTVYAKLDLRQPSPSDTVVLGESGALCTVRVQNGAVSVHAASCPDKLCVNHAPIGRAGEIIVCLPNRVVVEVTGQPRFDAASY